VNLGRIGLDFYAANPAIVYAIIESEKIATLPEDSPRIAVRTVDAEVGAKIEQVTKDSAAEKAGLAVNDIAVAVNNVVVHNSEQFWNQVRLHRAGETVQLEVSREKKPVKIELLLETEPGEDGPNAGRNPFTGVLGGQAANLQDQQGESGANYGGVYQSTDSGQTWARINSLNPRPMYYSQIRVDPKDNQYLYVLGTSMHRSKDGGKVFEEGGDRGVHPDHHALWIDPRDPRHMILGNDGGIYVTYDRMETWDHLNHVAIGQFYHAGADQRLDYWVYGGLQDNGSWGAAVRAASGGGPVNSDWINVGGGDGFVCVVDPENPNIVYAESQNGGMTRLDLATGQQSGISPRPQQGVRYRFNWKTPFALAPQNSRIFYTAGNFVFRSVADGTSLAPISEDICNSSKGSGSALAVSPLQFGLLYVGTTDGAIWMTKDDGRTWTAIFSRPEPPAEETPGADGTPAGPAPETVQGIAGTWSGSMGGQGGGGRQRTFDLTLDVDPEGKISGTYATPRSTLQIESGSYDPATRKLHLDARGERGPITIDAEIRDARTMEGTFAMGERMQLTFTAKRPAPAGQAAEWMNRVAGMWELKTNSPDRSDGVQDIVITPEFRSDQSIGGTASVDGRSIPIDEASFDADSGELRLNFGDDQHDYEVVAMILNRRVSAWVDVDFGRSVFAASGWRLPAQAPAPTDAATVVGQWKGVLESDSIPAPMNQLTLNLRDDSAKGFVGTIAAANQTFEVESGSLDSATGQLALTARRDDATISIDARLVGSVMVAQIHAAGGSMQFFFSAERQPDNGDEQARTPEAPQVEPERGDPPAPAAAEGNDPTEGRDAEPGAMPAEQQETPAQESETPPAARRPPQEPGQTPPKEGERDDPSESAQQQEPSQDEPRAQEKTPVQEEETKPADPISGTWNGTFRGDMFRGERARFTLTLKKGESGKLTGSLMTSRGETTISDGSFDEATGKLVLSGSNENSTVELAANLVSGALQGTITMGGGRFTIEFEAARPDAKDATPPGVPLETLLPGPRWVSSLTASRYEAGRVYLTLDGHRSDDDTPYVFASEDFGATWRSLRGNLPQEAGSVHALREDLENPNLLYLGCEFSAWVSIDRGQSWAKLTGLPTVAVHEFAFNGPNREVIAATHGRSLWVGDASLLQQLTPEILQQPTYLFAPKSVVRWTRSPSRGSSGTRRFIGQNPPTEATFAYSINTNVGQVELIVRDILGTRLKSITGTTERGLHTVTWDLATDSEREPGRRGRGRSRVPAGDYLVQLLVDGRIDHQAILKVLDDPAKQGEGADAGEQGDDLGDSSRMEDQFAPLP
jgi:photosystem II stability/assembly factor-like uncharacterized protein